MCCNPHSPTQSPQLLSPRQAGSNMERWQKPESENPYNATCNDQPSRSSLDYNTPLRSLKGNPINSPSPFYKLSSELSRESLRIPGTVPFVWEQRPGCRKYSATSIAPTSPPHGQLPKSGTPSGNTDLAKPSLATLFRQSSREFQGKAAAMASPSPTVDPSTTTQITPSVATDHLRFSNAHHSAVQPNAPMSLPTKNAALQDDIRYAASDSTSDVLTATAGGLSIDDSLMLSGPLRPASTPSEARDFIMHRFLPAAQTIAGESPQTPSRRFLPLGIAAGPASTSPSHHNHSFRDHGGVATRTESWLMGGPKSRTTNSPLVSHPGMPTPGRRQFQEESYHSDSNDIDHGIHEEEEEEEEDEEEAPSTPTACCIFPFRIHISIHSHHSTTCSSSSAKQRQLKSQQLHKKSIRPTRHGHTAKRIMDILREDQLSGCEDESLVRQPQSRHFGAERRIAPLKQTPTHCYIPVPLPNAAIQRSFSDFNNEKAFEYGSYYDAASRLCSPSPAALHLQNTRVSRTKMPCPFVAPQSTRSSVGSADDSPHPAIITTTEQPLLNSSLHYFSVQTPINNKPHAYPSQIGCPSCLNPLPSHVNCSNGRMGYHDNITKDTHTENWGALPHVNNSEQSIHIISNALYENENQEVIHASDLINPSMSNSRVTSHSSNYTGIHHEGEAQSGHPAEWDANTIGDAHARESASSSNGSDHIRHGDHYMGNGDGQHEGKVDADLRVSTGSLRACNGVQCVHHGILCGGNGGLHACHGAPYLRDGVLCVGNGGLHCACGDFHEGKMGNRGFPTSLLSPPLPKSPTHSWLGRAMPLVASANKSPNTSSRLAYLQNKAAAPAADHGSGESKQAPPPPAADSKWEALVKGSQLQRGHLLFSEELFHGSQTIVSGAS